MTSMTGWAADAAGRLLAALARAADRGLDASGLAPPPLDLPAQILVDLRELFRDTIDPGSVVIRRGHLPGVPHRRAFALPGLIYLGADPGIVGSGAAHTHDRPRATPTLVHELVHIWQGRFLGPRYVVRALGEQVRLGRRAYDWRAVLDRADLPAPASGSHPSGRPGAFPVEAHAQLVSEAYAHRYRFSPATALARPSRDLRAMEQALAGLGEGRAPTPPGRAI